jgi:hypothetical protein
MPEVVRGVVVIMYSVRPLRSIYLTPGTRPKAGAIYSMVALT